MTKTCSILSCYAMYQHKIHIHNLQNLPNEKNRKIIRLKVTSAYDMCFSVYNQINRNSVEIDTFAHFLAKHWHFSLTEITAIIKQSKLLNGQLI